MASFDPPRAARPRRRFRAGRFLLRLVEIALVAGVVGFVIFLGALSDQEARPTRNADGIVVLTGGSSRVADAMELLASGYGKRLLISGVYWANRANDIGRSIPDNQSMFKCCVDLDHSAVNTRSNAVETRRWASERGFRSLIVVTSNYHMPRAILEMSHAMPDVSLIPFPVIGDKWREEPWWSSATTLRLLSVEYVKYCVAVARTRVGWIDTVITAVDDRLRAADKDSKSQAAFVAR